MLLFKSLPLSTEDGHSIESEEVLALAASNPDASPALLEVLANSSSPYVRSKVAGNQYAPVSVRDRLMSDCPSVRAALAHSPKAIERVWSLVSDENPSVRLSLAENTNLPDHIYEELVKDQDRQVAHQARRTLMKLRNAQNLTSRIFSLFKKAA
jgi:hypothetical protein